MESWKGGESCERSVPTLGKKEREGRERERERESLRRVSVQRLELEGTAPAHQQRWAGRYLESYAG